MKRFIYLFFAISLLTTIACEKDDVAENILNYDGENLTGPILDAGFHVAAVHFPSNLTTPFNGKQLEAIQYFMGAKPGQAKIVVYNEGSPSFPGATLLYEKDITNEIRTLQWNTHTLDLPVDITGEDIWIGIELTHNAQQQSIGCDAGPNISGGDWLFQSADNSWETYRNRTGESINWNIRGVISE